MLDLLAWQGWQSRKDENNICNFFKSHSKHEPVVETDGNGNVVTAKCDICLKGFSYLAFRPTNGWEKIVTVGIEDEAKQKCIGILPQDEQGA